VALIVATVVVLETQVALLITAVVLLLYVPVAVNWSVRPPATLAAAAVTAIDESVGAVTVSVAVPEMLPDVAVMVEVPAIKVVASPAALMVATVLVPELQVTVDVRSCVVLLL
jgi:hypothetical protein